MLRLWPLIATLALSQSVAPRPPDTSARAVVARAASHLKEYQEALQFVLADEATVQEVFNLRGARTARRQTSGEFFLAYVAADGGWLAVRDILTVDGKPVDAHDNVRELLNRGTLSRIARQVWDRNARYNLGSTVRNFNDPMLVLLILDDKHRSRFRFERRAVTVTPAGQEVTVAFTERDAPTLIRGSDTRPVFTRGEIAIDAATGRLRRSVITMKDGPTTATLTTVFTENEKLGLWLPVSLTERYEHKSDDRSEVIVAESTYSNYRRFNVKVIIK
jgi:hypothetical protein